MRKRHLLLLSLAALAACDDAGVQLPGPPSPGVAIDAPETDLVEGETLTLRVLVGGRRVPADRVSWESRDPRTVEVRAGVARAGAPGRTWVVARRGDDADSVLLVVHFAGLGGAAGGAGMRAGEALARMGGGAFFTEVLNAEPLAMHVVAANGAPSRSEGEALGRDSVLSLVLPPEVGEGVVPLQPCQVRVGPGFGIECGESSLYVRVKDPDGSIKVWVMVREEPLVLTEVEPPARAGTETGRLSGWVMFDAAGFRVVPGPAGTADVRPLADTTVRIYAEFSLPLYRMLRSSGRATFTGGPLTGSLQAFTFEPARWVADGLSMKMEMALPQGTPPFAARAYAWIPQPRPAPWRESMAALGPGSATDTAGGATPWVRMDAWEIDPPGGGAPPRPAVGRGGSLLVTGFDAPTDRHYGRIDGQLQQARLGYLPFINDSASVATVLALTFSAAIDPLGGVPWRGDVAPGPELHRLLLEPAPPVAGAAKSRARRR